MKNRIWIVGGSSGIGLELVKLWLEQAHNIIVSSRNATSNQDLLQLQSQYGSQIHLLDMDVTEEKSVLEGVKRAWDIWGGIDLWFYNAGSYESQPIKEWDIKNLELMNQTNYMGVVRLSVALYPLFKSQASGRWVFNASLSSYFGLPLGGGYSAPKAALVNLCQSLQPELARDNIQLQIINHGFVKTRLTDKNSFKMPQLMTPLEAAIQIDKGLKKKYQFELRFPKALGFFLRLLSILPNSWSLKLTKRMMDAT